MGDDGVDDWTAVGQALNLSSTTCLSLGALDLASRTFRDFSIKEGAGELVLTLRYGPNEGGGSSLDYLGCHVEKNHLGKGLLRGRVTAQTDDKSFIVKWSNDSYTILTRTELDSLRVYPTTSGVVSQPHTSSRAPKSNGSSRKRQVRARVEPARGTSGESRSSKRPRQATSEFHPPAEAETHRCLDYVYITSLSPSEQMAVLSQPAENDSFQCLLCGKLAKEGPNGRKGKNMKTHWKRRCLGHPNSAKYDPDFATKIGIEITRTKQSLDASSSTDTGAKLPTKGEPEKKLAQMTPEQMAMSSHLSETISSLPLEDLLFNFAKPTEAKGSLTPKSPRKKQFQCLLCGVIAQKKHMRRHWTQFCVNRTTNPLKKEGGAFLKARTIAKLEMDDESSLDGESTVSGSSGGEEILSSGDITPGSGLMRTGSNATNEKNEQAKSPDADSIAGTQTSKQDGSTKADSMPLEREYIIVDEDEEAGE